MAPLIVEDDFSTVGVGHAHGEGSSFWAPSLDPRNEEKMPMELRTWRRWSNQFDKEKELDCLQFDITTSCSNCSLRTWEPIDHSGLKTIQCRTCGITPSETRSPRTSNPISRISTHCSRSLPQTYCEDDEIAESSSAASSRTRSESEGSSSSWALTSENLASSSTMASSSSHAEASSSNTTASSSKHVSSHQDEITEQDFAAPSPRHLSAHESSGIKSVRQSMYEQPKPKPRWFEQKQNMTFQFKLTPRGRAGGSGGAPSASKVPKANEDGSTTESKISESGSEETSSSSKPPGSGGPTSTRNIPIHELSEDPTAWQRLLTSSLFLMKEDHLPKPGQSKVVDLGLAHSRGPGGKQLVMKHLSSGEHESIVQNETSEAKRVKWKVVVRPVGGGGGAVFKSAVPMANEDGSS